MANGNVLFFQEIYQPVHFGGAQYLKSLHQITWSPKKKQMMVK
jgi:hypothetical protein